MRKLLIVIFIYPCYFFGQNRTVDSLKEAIKQANHDTIRFSAMSSLIELENDEKIWLPINNELLKLSVKSFRSAKVASVAKTYSKYAAVALGNLAFYQESVGKITQAIQNYNRALKMLENTGLENDIASLKNNLALIYMDQGEIEKATEIFLKVLNVFEKLNDKRGMGRSLNNLAFIYQGQGNHMMALDYFERAIKCKVEYGDEIGIATTLNNIGFIYQSINNKDKALDYYRKSLVIREKLNDRSGVSGSLLNIGTIYFEQRKYEESFDYCSKAMKISEEMNDRSLMSTILSSMASVRINQKQYDDALKFAKMSYAISSELGYPEPIQNSADLLKTIYQKQGKFKEALEMFELYVRMRDSLNNESTRKSAIKSQLKYEYEKQAAADSVAHAKESEIKNVELAKQKVEINAKKNQQYALFGSLGSVIIFAGFMYNRFKITQKQKFIIEEQKIVVEQQKHLVEEKQREVLDSIHYAKRIQTALIPSEKYINKSLQRLKKI